MSSRDDLVECSIFCRKIQMYWREKVTDMVEMDWKYLAIFDVVLVTKSMSWEHLEHKTNISYS